MKSHNLDSRRHAYRPDLADATLRSQVSAPNYADGTTAQLSTTAPLRKSPDAGALLLTQGLMGESVQVFDVTPEWAWIQLHRDRYVGYVPASALTKGIVFTSHVVVSPRALIFPEPDLKTPPIGCLFQGAEVSIGNTQGDYVALAYGGFVHARTIAPQGTYAEDFVDVAQRYIGVPYLWGGKTADGLDCSGLIQVAMHATGRECPRDSDMQMEEIGTSIGTDANSNLLRRGDLVFWSKHVGVLTDMKTLLHANAWHMETALEPLANAVERIASDGKPVLDIRRP